MNTRFGEARDVAGIAAMEAVVFGADAWIGAQVSDELKAPTHTVVVAETDGVLVGFGCISEAGDVVDLLRIAVVPSARRIGVASLILRALVDQVHAADRMLVEVASSNVGAQGFYAVHGFTEIARRRGYYASGDDAVVMSHRLG